MDVLVLEEIGDANRLKWAISVEESLGSVPTSFAGCRTTIRRSSSTSSLNSLVRQQVEGHLLDFNQWVEAVGETTIKSEATGCSSEEDECSGGMKLFHLVVACAEAVAWRDKSYASILLSDLRCQALVLGSSFQRAASCFVQGLANRLASIQPLGFSQDWASNGSVSSTTTPSVPTYSLAEFEIPSSFTLQRREIKNIVSCEGPRRVERHEKVEQWRRRMSRAGFQAVPMKMVGKPKRLESKKEFEGYTIVEEKGCLILGWKTKPITAASCWKCWFSLSSPEISNKMVCNWIE